MAERTVRKSVALYCHCSSKIFGSILLWHDPIPPCTRGHALYRYRLLQTCYVVTMQKLVALVGWPMLYCQQHNRPQCTPEQGSSVLSSRRVGREVAWGKGKVVTVGGGLNRHWWGTGSVAVVRGKSYPLSGPTPSPWGKTELPHQFAGTSPSYPIVAAGAYCGAKGQMPLYLKEPAPIPTTP